MFRFGNTSTRNLLFLSLILFFIPLIVYIRMISSGFAYDDFIIIVNNPTIQNLSMDQIRNIFSVGYWHPHLQIDNLYRPLVILTYAFEYLFVGVDPSLYHVTNIVLHIANGFLVFRLLFLLLRSVLPSFCGALVFSLHPALSEVVCNITCRGDSLSVFFVFLAGVIYAERKGPTISPLRVLTICSCALMAFFSKESGIVVIGFLGLIGLVSLESKQGFVSSIWALLKQEKNLYLALSGTLIMGVVIRSSVLKNVGVQYAVIPPELNPLKDSTPFVRLLTSIKLIGLYFWKIIFPKHLTFDYGAQQIEAVQSPFNTGFILSFLILVALLVFAKKLWENNKIPAVSLLLVLGPLLPTLNIFFISTSIFNERGLYLPMFGFVLFISDLTRRLISSDRKVLYKRLAFLVVGLLVISFGLRSHFRSMDWAGKESIVTSTRDSSPNSCLAQLDFSMLLFEKGDLDGAEEFCGRAIQLFPGSQRANYCMGFILQKKGLASEAIPYFTLAVRQNRNEWSLKSAMKLGYLYSVAGDKAAAEKYFREAIRINPLESGAYKNLAILFEGVDETKYQYFKKKAEELGRKFP